MGKTIAIIGATGAVGREMINCLEAVRFPVKSLRLGSSKRSAGKTVKTPFGAITLELPSEEMFKTCDIALFSAGGDVSKELAPLAKKNGCLVIDNSSAFRYDDDVPLVVPQINGDMARRHAGIIANPNCTTAIAVMVLWPLHKEFRLKKVIMATYQATSGAGKEGMDELIEQTKEYLEKRPLTVKYFKHPIAFNIIPHIDAFQENGYTKEEMKVAWETRKIFGDETIAISCTAVRIPTLRAHSESIVIETEKPIDPKVARDILARSPGVKLVDDPEHNIYPMPLNASGAFDVEAGRIRQNPVFGEHGLEFFVSGDQLLRGAALNAVEIAQLFV